MKNFSLETRFYSYVYLDPRKPGRYTYDNFVTFFYEPFYVGKGSGRRMYSHLSEKEEKSTNTHKTRKIAKIREKFDIKSFIVKVGAECNEFISSCCMEPFLIQTIGRDDLGTGPLTNKSAGGDGITARSDETKRKQSLKMKGVPRPSKQGKPSWNAGKTMWPEGRSFSKEHCEAISSAKKGKPAANKGKPGSPCSEERKRKLSERTKGKKQTPEQIEKRTRATKETRHLKKLVKLGLFCFLQK